MAGCKDMDDKLLDYLYEELAPEERRAFEEHLGGCGRCQAELASFGGVRRAARGLELVEPPQAVSAKLMYQATQLAPRRGRVLRFGRVRTVVRHPAFAMAASFLVVGGVVGWQYLARGPEGLVAVAPRPEAAAPATPAAQAAAAEEKPAEGAGEDKEDRDGRLVGGYADRAQKDEAAKPQGSTSLRASSRPAARDLEAEPPALVTKAPVRKKLDAFGGREELELSKNAPVKSAPMQPPGVELDQAVELPELGRAAGGGAGQASTRASKPRAKELSLGQGQNQQLAVDTLPRPPAPVAKTRGGPADDQQPPSPSAPATAVAASPAPEPLPPRSTGAWGNQNRASQTAPAQAYQAPAGSGQQAFVEQQNNESEGDAACREIERRIQARTPVSAEELWMDLQCLRQRGQLGSSRAQRDLERLARDFPAFRSSEVAALRGELDALVMRSQQRQQQLEAPGNLKRATKAKAAERNAPASGDRPAY